MRISVVRRKKKGEIGGHAIHKTAMIRGYAPSGRGGGGRGRKGGGNLKEKVGGKRFIGELVLGRSRMHFRMGSRRGGGEDNFIKKNLGLGSWRSIWG